MNSARLSSTSSGTPNAKAVMIHADSKSAAKEAILLAKAWIKANGGQSKVVYFISTPSEYSNLVMKYRARIVYKGTFS